MALEQFANNPSTTVLSGGTTEPSAGTSETWTVSNAAYFPAASSTASPPTQFHISDPELPDEIIAVTNTSGNNWAVTRGAESTIPAAHASGFSITQVVSAGAFGGFVQTSQMTSAIATETERAETAEAGLLPIPVGTAVVGQVPTVTQVSPLELDWAASGGMTNPMTATGDTVYGGASGAATRLPGNTAATRKFLTETGTGSAANAPVWNTITVADLPTATTGAEGIVQLAGDLGGTAASPEVLKIQGTEISAPAGGASAYLNSEGAWSEPAGGGTFGGGTLTEALAPEAEALTFGTSIPVNAALGNAFNLPLTASTGTIANPTNPTEAQVIRFRISQDTTGGRTVAWGSAYDFGTAGSAPTLSTAANKVDIIAFEYVASISKWACLNSGGLGY